jgi:hypothetical protein
LTGGRFGLPLEPRYPDIRLSARDDIKAHSFRERAFIVTPRASKKPGFWVIMAERWFRASRMKRLNERAISGFSGFIAYLPIPLLSGCT